MYKFLIPLFALSLLVGCSPAEDTTPNPDPMPEEVQQPRSSAPVFDGQILSGLHTVTLKTSVGDITLELNADAAPKTVTNFIGLAKVGYYNGLTFHRVIEDFMIQGGDPNGNGTGGESIFGAKFEDEINAKSYSLDTTLLKDSVGNQKLPPHLEQLTVQEFLEGEGYSFNEELESLPMERGAIAMANAGPNTNGSQFFIIQAHGGTPWLEGKHTVFGKVTEGLDIVDEVVQEEKNNDGPVTFTVEVE